MIGTDEVGREGSIGGNRKYGVTEIKVWMVEVGVKRK